MKLETSIKFGGIEYPLSLTVKKSDKDRVEMLLITIAVDLDIAVSQDVTDDTAYDNERFNRRIAYANAKADTGYMLDMYGVNDKYQIVNLFPCYRH